MEDLAIVIPYSIAAYREFVKGDDAAVLRQTIKDVAATFRTADFVTEAQVRKAAFYDERSLLYPLERFCGNYNKAGQMKLDAKGRPLRYSSLRPVYSLNIMGYEHFPDDDALRIFELVDEKRGKRFKTEYLRIGFFELVKGNVETPNQRHWQEYFNTGAAAGDAPEYIKKASHVIEYSNLTQEELDMARTLERAQAEYDADMYGSYVEGEANGILIGEARGITIGKAEGKAEGKVEVLDLMKGYLGEGLSLEAALEKVGAALNFDAGSHIGAP